MLVGVDEGVTVLVGMEVLVGVDEGVTVLVGEAVGVEEDVAVGVNVLVLVDEAVWLAVAVGSTTRMVRDAPGTSRMPKVTVPTVASATVADAPGWSDPEDHV
ncbi:MAG: hypothetical protein EBU54_15830 [Mycobacteriaceae bacterium]|nr:hypothetical protein [Mycobacteriaceae bacterium]